MTTRREMLALGLPLLLTACGTPAPAPPALPEAATGRLARSAVVAQRQMVTTAHPLATEAGIAFDDPDVGVAWPADMEFTVSERDRRAPRLREVADGLPFAYRG